MRALVVFTTILLVVPSAFAKSPEACGAQNCADCHSLTITETEALLGSLVDRVNSVEFAEVPGMWAVEVEKDQKKLPIYIDFSKRYLVSGNVIRLDDGENLTRKRSAQMNTIDIGKIPLADALLLGRAAAKTQIIVFTDPECPYCKKLHEELKEVVRRDPEVAFLIKLYPLKMHPNAYDISKSIVCNNSMEYLELSFAGKPVPPPNCEMPVIDQTIALARELGIRSTPNLIMPDGRLLPGYRKAEEILAIISDYAAQAGK